MNQLKRIDGTLIEESETKTLRELLVKNLANLSGANLRGVDLSGVDLDFSCLNLSCKSLSAKYDQKHIVQFLYHAAMPTQNNKLNISDPDLLELLDSELFKKCVNKFHHVEECGKFEGPKK